MEHTTSDITEAELETVFEHSCKMDGAQWLSFPPVVAGGERALSLHYIKNDQLLKYVTQYLIHVILLFVHLSRDGEMVLMDAGCEYYGYVSDVTRTWPVNGRYTPAQRALYEVVFDVQKLIISATKANETLNHLHHLASNLLSEKLKGKYINMFFYMVSLF